MHTQYVHSRGSGRWGEKFDSALSSAARGPVAAAAAGAAKMFAIAVFLTVVDGAEETKDAQKEEK